jgi:hypothetical protein
MSMTRPFTENTRIVISAYSETWTPEDVEAGDASVRDVEHENEIVSPEQLEMLARDMGIDSPSASDPHGAPNIWFTSSSPRQDRAHFEKGVNTHFSLHIHAIDGEPPTEIGIQRIADCLGVDFSVPLNIPAMPNAVVTSGDGKVMAVLDAAPWLGAATPSEISDLMENDFEGTEAADEIYYRALRENDPAARELAAYLISPSNSAAGFELAIDPGEAMRWLEENRGVLHAQLVPETDRPIFGYYINLDERGDFYADVRDVSGESVFEIRVDAGDEDNIFTDGFMSDKNDIMGLKAYMVDLGILKEDSLLMETTAFERALEVRKDDTPSPEFG